MKLFLISLLLSAAPPWIAGAAAQACDGKEKKDNVIVVVKDGKAAKVDCNRIVTTSGEPGRAIAFVNAVGVDKDDGRSEPRMVWFSGEKGANKGREGRGWLGVSIDSVPGAMESQLDLKGRGVIVVNVVGDSPADRAGLEAHDIILEIDGNQISGEVGRAVDLVKSHKPGDKVNIVILREGQDKTITVELGARSEVKAGDFEWKFESDEQPDVDVEESIHTRGKIMRRGPNDEWIIEDLGDLNELKELPKRIKMFVPKSGSRSVQMSLDGDHKTIKAKVERDGSNMAITQKGDGPIKVTKVDEDGRKTEATYETEDELRKSDEEAYDLWSQVTDSMVIHLDVDGIEIPDIEIPDIDIPDLKFYFDTDEWKEHAEEWKEGSEEWRRNLEESLGAAQEAYEQAMKQFNEAMAQWKAGKGGPGGLKAPPPPPMFHGKGEAPELPWMTYRQGSSGKPQHTFEVRTDGTIEVRIRKGGSELVQLYQDESDLARRSPKLYKKYEKLMDLEEKE